LVLAGGLSLLTLSGCSKEPSGTYEASAEGMTMSIDFKADHKFHMTTTAPIIGASSEDGDYTMKDDKVSLKTPGMPQALDLTKKGDTLEGNFMGRTLKFVKK
jgi:hypothetical protein